MTNPVKVSRQVSQSVVMQAIAQDGPISRASLAKQIGLSKQTISEVVKQLEKNGWEKMIFIFSNADPPRHTPKEQCWLFSRLKYIFFLKTG